jgi:hypothetical protein
VQACVMVRLLSVNVRLHHWILDFKTTVRQLPVLLH